MKGERKQVELFVGIVVKVLAWEVQKQVILLKGIAKAVKIQVMDLWERLFVAKTKKCCLIVQMPQKD